MLGSNYIYNDETIEIRDGEMHEYNLTFSHLFLNSYIRQCYKFTFPQDTYHNYSHAVFVINSSFEATVDYESKSERISPSVTKGFSTDDLSSGFCVNYYNREASQKANIKIITVTSDKPYTFVYSYNVPDSLRVSKGQPDGLLKYVVMPDVNFQVEMDATTTVAGLDTNTFTFKAGQSDLVYNHKNYKFGSYHNVKYLYLSCEITSEGYLDLKTSEEPQVIEEETQAPESNPTQRTYTRTRSQKNDHHHRGSSGFFGGCMFNIQKAIDDTFYFWLVLNSIMFFVILGLAIAYPNRFYRAGYQCKCFYCCCKPKYEKIKNYYQDHPEHHNFCGRDSFSACISHVIALWGCGCFGVTSMFCYTIFALCCSSNKDEKKFEKRLKRGGDDPNEDVVEPEEQNAVPQTTGTPYVVYALPPQYQLPQQPQGAPRPQQPHSPYYIPSNGKPYEPNQGQAFYAADQPKIKDSKSEKDKKKSKESKSDKKKSKKSQPSATAPPPYVFVVPQPLPANPQTPYYTPVPSPYNN